MLDFPSPLGLPHWQGTKTVPNFMHLYIHKNELVHLFSHLVLDWWAVTVNCYLCSHCGML